MSQLRLVLLLFWRLTRPFLLQLQTIWTFSTKTKPLKKMCSHSATLPIVRIKFVPVSSYMCAYLTGRFFHFYRSWASRHAGSPRRKDSCIFRWWTTSSDPGTSPPFFRTSSISVSVLLETLINWGHFFFFSFNELYHFVRLYMHNLTKSINWQGSGM